jgi:transposase
MCDEIRLTDAQWARITPLLPARRRMGRPRADDRRTIDGILYVLKTGCRWQDLPAGYGAYVTAWRRLRAWARDGTWQRVWQALLADLEADRRLDWERCALDGSYVRAKGGAIR